MCKKLIKNSQPFVKKMKNVTSPQGGFFDSQCIVDALSLFAIICYCIFCILFSCLATQPQVWNKTSVSVANISECKLCQNCIFIVISYVTWSHLSMSWLKGVPRNVNYREMKLDLRRLPGVEAVHSLNVWSLTMDKIVVTVHLAVGRYNTLDHRQAPWLLLPQPKIDLW